MKLSQLADMDPRIIFMVMLVLVGIPFVHTVGFPIVIHKEAREFYSYIERLPAGSVIAYEVDAEMGLWSEAGPPAIAVLNHLLTKDVKLVFCTFMEDGVMLTARLLKEADQTLLGNKKYGEDYAVFGYVPGGETAVANFASDIHRTIPKDVRGNPTAQLPMMTKIHNAKDISLVVNVNSRFELIEYTVRQWGVTWEVPLLYVTQAMMLPGLVPYYPRFCKAYIYGIPGAAEYERLVGKLGQATTFTDSISIAFAVVLVFLLIGNIGYLKARVERGKKEKT